MIDTWQNSGPDRPNGRLPRRFFGYCLGAQDYVRHEAAEWLEGSIDAPRRRPVAMDRPGHDLWRDARPLDRTPATDGVHSSDLFAAEAKKVFAEADETIPLFLYFAAQTPHAHFVEGHPERHRATARRLGFAEDDRRYDVAALAAASAVLDRGSRRRRGHDVDIPWTGRGAAAAITWIFHGWAAARSRRDIRRVRSGLERRQGDTTLVSAQVAALDEQVGAVEDALATRGGDAVFWFLGDNGPEAGLGASAYPLRGAKRTCFEGGLRTPAFVYAPGLVRPGATSAPVHVVDVAPTLLALAGAPAGALGRRGLDGRDARPDWDRRRGWRPPRVLVLFYDNVASCGAAVRGDLKRVRRADLPLVSHGDAAACDADSPRGDASFAGETGPAAAETGPAAASPRFVSKDYPPEIASTEYVQLAAAAEPRPVSSTYPRRAIRGDESARLRYVLNAGCEYPDAAHSGWPDAGEDAPLSCVGDGVECLFNVADDPAERVDVKARHPAVFDMLRAALLRAQAEAVASRVRTTAGDPLADPARHGGKWVSWLDA